MTKYLLDSNIYLNFYDRYYKYDYFPTFWNAFKEIINQQVVIPKVVIDEHFQDKWFLDWLKANFHNEIINHKTYAADWAEVLSYVASCGLYKDSALASDKGWAHDKIADPWIIAMAKSENLVVVTSELKNYNLNPMRPSKSAKIPDVCDGLSVRCIDMNTFFKEINLII